MSGTEEAMAGGVNVVVRIGRTVHRPTGPWTPTVHAVLRHLAAAGHDRFYLSSIEYIARNRDMYAAALESAAL